ncbi:MAG: lytic murein transglycosylase [Candidatus Nealsonbacteria bacterium]|nr:lytic murein transglycosylase [Candidatus Nealsonbacteria bacterium]
MSKFSKILILVLFLAFVLPNFFSFAQTTPREERQALERELREVEERIIEYEKDIQKTEREKRTLRNDIALLRRRIEKLDLQARQSNIMIKDIAIQIKDTEGSIDRTALKINDSKKRIINILRAIYKEEQRSFIEILFFERRLSNFFSNLMTLENLHNKNSELLENIKNLKIRLESQKKSLDQEKEDLARTRKVQLLQKEENVKLRRERDSLLRLTQAQYQQYLRGKEEIKRRAVEIRARIFQLIGVADVPTFGEAYDLAKYVEGITGVRPAFLLAILKQESNIGRNVGQCFLRNPRTGEGVGIRNGRTIQRVMHPRRDAPIFLQITERAGRDPFNTPVSCPMEFGWGGAMGPAQFIPSTWIRYKERVRAITGSADPWNIKDSFVAAGLHLANNGANRRTPEAEWRAAMIYFAGTVNLRFRFYGDSVMRIARGLEGDIRDLERLAQLPKSLAFFKVFIKGAHN